MIRGVAFCPTAPVLIPELAQGAAVELAALRAACRQAIRDVVRPGSALVLVGPAEHAARFGPTARGSLFGLGLQLEIGLSESDDGAPARLPLSLTVGCWLVRDALGALEQVSFEAVSSQSPPAARYAWEDDDRDVRVVVLGDGSACRGVKAPGYLDPRAAEWDATLAQVLGEGDADALCGLDAGLGTELLAAGTPAWRAVAPSLRNADWDARLHYDDAPYGVGYLVASWLRRD